MKAGAVVWLGLVLAASAWGHSDAANYREVLSSFADWDRLSLLASERSHSTQVYFQRGAAGGLHAELYATDSPPGERSACHSTGSCRGAFAVGTVTDGAFRMVRIWDRSANVRISTDGVRRAVAVTLPEYGTEYIALAFYDKLSGSKRHFKYAAHTHYTPREPEPPAPPPEPEPPEPPEPPGPEPPPEPEPPEPETPSEPEPDHTHPVERCDHLAIVPAMPKALPGDEDAADHWLRISNLGAASITFAITGHDEAGTKGGTYRRELPASRSVKVKMRDVEAAFDVEPEGWWTLTVTGSGPLYASATMKQGDARRFVPVERPATCPSGPVTRTGG